MSLRHMLWVLDHSEAEHGARLVMLSLAEHANDRDEAYPAVDTIARQTKLSERAVQYALRSLVDTGELTRLEEPSQHETTRYLLGGAKSAGGAENDAPGVQNSTSHIAPEPTTLFNPTTEPSTREREIEEIAEHYRQCFPKKRFKLHDKHVKLISKALDVRPVETCKRAITGLASDEFLVQGGYTEIEYALKGKRSQTDEERIDRMAEKVAATNGAVDPLAHVPSAQRGMVRERQRHVEAMLTTPGDEMPQSVLEAGRLAETYLRDQLGLTAARMDGRIVWTAA